MAVNLENIGFLSYQIRFQKFLKNFSLNIAVLTAKWKFDPIRNCSRRKSRIDEAALLPRTLNRRRTRVGEEVPRMVCRGHPVQAGNYYSR